MRRPLGVTTSLVAVSSPPREAASASWSSRLAPGAGLLLLAIVNRLGLGSLGSSSMGEATALAAAGARAMAGAVALVVAAGAPLTRAAPTSALGAAARLEGATSWLIKATMRQAKQTAELIRMSRMAPPSGRTDH